MEPRSSVYRDSRFQTVEPQILDHYTDKLKATVVVNPSPKSVWHIIFELSSVDPVVILSPSSDSTSLAILIYLAFVLVWKSIVSEAVSDF